MKNDFLKEKRTWDAIGKCRIGTNYSANQFQMPGNNKMIHSFNMQAGHNPTTNTKKTKSWYCSLTQRGFFLLLLS